MDCMQWKNWSSACRRRSVSIPQAVWIACNASVIGGRCRSWKFQYRKRYGLHAMTKLGGMIHGIFSVSIPQAVWIACNEKLLYTVQGLVEFQYRKRYGLHAIIKFRGFEDHPVVSIPQAVWIACNDPGKLCACLLKVSIPQAVWIACNISPGCMLSPIMLFQYRKRYGLHAISAWLMKLPRWLGQFQYRKRYGLHAMKRA